MDKNKIVSLKYTPISTNKHLYDGLEREFVNKQFKIEIDEKQITFSSLEFSSYQGKYFKNLEKILDSKFFDTMIKEGGFKRRIPASLGYFSKEEHLSIEYFTRGGYIFVFTFGEKQPSRWILVLEGVWEIKV